MHNNFNIIFFVKEIFSSTMCKLKRMHYSLAHLGAAFFLILFAVSIMIITSISVYYSNLLRTQFYNNTMDILRLYNNERSSDLSVLDTYLFQMASYNTDISIINTTSDNLKYYNAKAKIHLLLSESLLTFDKIDGLYFYSPSADDFIYVSASSSAVECSPYIRSFLHSNRKNIYHLDGVYTKWLPYQGKDHTYLIRFLVSGNSIIGAWSSTETLTSDFNGVFSNDSVICYADEQRQILNNPAFSSFIPDEEQILDHYQIYTQPDTGVKYLAASEALTYSNCYLTAFIPLSNVDRFMLPVYQKLFFIILILLSAILLIAVVFKRLTDAPLHYLETALSAIRQGEDNALIPDERTRCKEISALNKTLNDMIQKIRDLKINVYEEKLLKSNIELQYMKAQISPHFLINCLTTFSSLATAQDQTGDKRYLLRKLVDTLSNHLRYTLSSRSQVTLQEELSYVDNYLQLISLRYPGCLAWKIQLPDNLQDLPVFPMILLMLTENSIKHNMIMGEKLEIIIQALEEKRDKNLMVHLIHIDSGNGFSEERLFLCRTILEHPELCKDGHNIGIYNIAKSLQLTYHGAATLQFSNEPGKGARIDIYIPSGDTADAEP